MYGGGRQSGATRVDRQTDKQKGLITMIIKFKSDPDKGEWTIYDRCSNVSILGWREVPIDENGHPSQAIDEMYVAFGWGELALKDKPVVGKTEGTRLVRAVRWFGPNPESDERTTMLLVTDLEPMYLMSDEGKTLERI